MRTTSSELKKSKEPFTIFTLTIIHLAHQTKFCITIASNFPGCTVVPRKIEDNAYVISRSTILFWEMLDNEVVKTLQFRP